MIKRFFDIALIALFSPLICVLTIFICFILYLQQGKPLLFKQERIGKDCKAFTLYKFRTMEITAEEDFHKSHYLDLSKGKKIEPNNSPLEPIRIENDDRITKIGMTLRKTSLDELPNLLNVLKGEMSLIGPRPLVDYEAELYGDYNSKRCSVIPGITGLAQIQGRLDLSLQERLFWDLEYIKNYSLKEDIKILIKTVFSVLSRKGAN